MMIISGIINLIVFVLLGIAVEKLLLFATRQKNLNQSFMYFIANICKYFFISVGILTLTAYLGIDIRGILTGLGLTGFALGFALKDALSNFISGIFILCYKPFTLDQTISIEINKGVISRGTVKSINLRYTTLENNQEIILVPNAILFTNAITIHK